VRSLDLLVSAVDAYETGYGVVCKTMPKHFVSLHASHQERWRCKLKDGFTAPRTRAFEIFPLPPEADRLEQIEMCVSVQPASGFPEVDPKLTPS